MSLRASAVIDRSEALAQFFHQAEVEYLDDVENAATLAQHDVRRLDVAVDDPGVVCLGQRRLPVPGSSTHGREATIKNEVSSTGRIGGGAGKQMFQRHSTATRSLPYYCPPHLQRTSCAGGDRRRANHLIPGGIMEQVSLLSLWLPVLVSAVVVFFAGFIAWTVLPHHRSDWVPVPNEDPLLNAIRGMGLGRGQYVFPHAMTPEGQKAEGAKEKVKEGPVGSLVIWDAPNMGRSMVQYFVFCLGVSFMVGYVGYATMPAGVEYLGVFRVLGTVAFMAYAAAEIPPAIWFGHTWSSVWKSVVDGLVFGLLTGGVFGWLWP
jgi:hypothetical protein